MMDAVKSFNDELSSIYETKPPVSRAKMTTLTKKAIKGIKFYKHIVQSMEKFIQKCRPEYKVPGLYVIDSVVRQSRHQFGQEKDVFMPRLCKNILNTFKHLYKCPQDEKQRIMRVLNLWQKNAVFPPEIVQQLLAMGGMPASGASVTQPTIEPVPLLLDEKTLGASLAEAVSSASVKSQPDAGALTNMLAQLLANPNNPQIQQLTGLLSTSQQAQLQALVSQVKDEQEEPEDIKPPLPPKPDPPQMPESSVFQPRQDNSLPPFLQTESGVGSSSRPNASFNRAVLDFDYSDDESPKSQEQSKHQHKSGIDLELLAKLPTVDQLKQLSAASGGQLSNGDGLPRNTTFLQQHEFQRQDENDKRRKLEEEQEVFNKQIQQMSSEFNASERSQDDRSSRSTSRRRRSRSKKRSRSRDRHRHRKRSRSRERHKKRSRSRDRHRSRHHRSRSADQEREKERERERNGLPPLREGCVSLCSKTLWIGNLASKVSQQEIKTEVEAHGPIESINMIPPRGCAYICMEKREDAAKALHRLRHVRIGGKALKVDWAPGKEVKEEFKEFWSKEHGVNYIPLEKVVDHLTVLKSQGFIDMESIPDSKKSELQGEGNDDNMDEEMPQASVLPPAGMMNPPMQGVMPGGMPVMMRPAFPFPGVAPRMNQFVPPQRMPGFHMPPGMPAPPRSAASIDAPSQQKQPETIIGNKTPTQDEKLDGAQKAAAVAASIMSSVQPHLHQQQHITMAQPRFQGVGQLPVQIRMMPGMSPHQQVMSAQRIGMNMMPIRMGMPMQFRPGFARVPMAQPMMPFQQQQMQMQRMGQMVHPLHHQALHVPGGPVRLRGPLFPGQPSEVEAKDPEIEKRKDEQMKENPNIPQAPKRDEAPLHPGMGRPPIGRPPSMEERVMRMGERPPMGERLPPHMDGRPPPMNDRPPFGFRRSPPPGRFGFGGHRPMDGPEGPRFPERDRFPEHELDRDDRRRDDGRRGDRSRERSRDGDRRGMRDRDRRFDDRDRMERPAPGFGDWGRDRGGRFGGRDDFGRGRGRGGFRGGFGGQDRGRFEEEPTEEELEYQRKREEVLRQRREKEETYVVEEVDLSAFGLPSGFGPPPSAEQEETNEEEAKGEKSERRTERDDDRRRDRDRDRRDDRDRNRDRRDRDRDRDRDRRRDDRDRSRRDRDRRRSRDRDRERRRSEDKDKKTNSDEVDGSQENKRIKLEGEADQKPSTSDTTSTTKGEPGLPDEGVEIKSEPKEFKIKLEPQDIVKKSESNADENTSDVTEKKYQMQDDASPDPSFGDQFKRENVHFHDEKSNNDELHEPSHDFKDEDMREPPVRESTNEQHGNREQHHDEMSHEPHHDFDSAHENTGGEEKYHDSNEGVQCKITNPDIVKDEHNIETPPSKEQQSETPPEDVAIE